MTVKVGDAFRTSYADGMFTFTVIEVTGKFVLAEMEENPDWGPVEKAFTVREAEGLIGWARSEDAQQKRHDDFWDAQQPGTVLHYHNGFGEWVRGVVTSRNGEKKFLPTTMVGTWRHSWEYHWVGILRERSWQPHAGNVYESPLWERGDSDGDPRDMTPLDFSDRPATDYLKHLLQM